MSIQGIDVSKHQHKIDWLKVKESGIKFAILRAGYGKSAKQIDKYFETNYTQAKAVNMPVGAYWYSYAKTVDEAKLEAAACLEVIKGKKFEYPIYFDIEDKSQKKLSKAVKTNICITFCEALEKAGYYTGIYCNPDWITNHLDASRLTAYDKWLAHWVSVPKWGAEFGGLWQYTGSGRVNGIKGDVDRDISYRDYPAIIKGAGLNGFIKESERKPLDNEGFKKGDSGNGVLCLNELLLIAYKQGVIAFKVTELTAYGEITAACVNSLLLGWGYSTNGIAGENFIKKLAAELLD